MRATSMNSAARSYRSSRGRKPARRKFSPVNASGDVTAFHAAAAVAEVIQRGELAGQLEGLVERGVQGGGETDAVGHRSEQQQAR